jgi:hypothetical protein
MVMEAVHLKVQMEDIKLREEAEQEAARKSFKQDFSELEEFRNK